MNIKITPPIIFAVPGEINESSAVPMVMDANTIKPEQSIMIHKACIGTSTFRMPYVMPTPNPSRLTAITKKNSPI